MLTTTQDYTLTTSDMDAWVDIVSIQNITGYTTPIVSDQNTAALAAWIDKMTLSLIFSTNGGTWQTPVCSTIKNTLLKSWMESFFEGLGQIATTYNGALYPEMYLANTFRLFVDSSDCMDCLQQNSFYQAFSAGANSIPGKYADGACSSPSIGPWGRPSVPASWNSAINKAFTKWGTNGVPTSLANASNIYSASAWPPGMPLKLYSYPYLSKLEENTLADIVAAKQLDDDTCIFLMYLLSALPTSEINEQVAVKAMVQHPVTSYELGADNFISHLIYYVLMCWVDPLGDFLLTGEQMKNKLNNLNSVLLNPDAATQTIKTALQKYVKILTAVPTYPMTDPYDTQDGFITRQSDILFALNTAWATFSQ